MIETRQRQGNLTKITVIYYASFICLGMATAVLGPTLQGLAKNTGSSLAQISSLFLLCSFGYLLGSYASGRVFDRVSGHPVLAFSLLMVASIMFLVPLAKELIFLQILFFIIGVGEGSLDVGINTLIVWLHGDHVPPFMNGLHAFYGIGTTSAPLVVAAIIGNFGSLSSIYWTLAALFLPVGMLLIFSPSPSHIQSRQQTELRPAIPILVFLSTATFFVFTGAELGFGGWIYTYSTSQVSASPVMAASINAVFWASITVGRLISIPIAVKQTSQKILWGAFGGVIVSLLVIILFSSSESLLWLGTIGTGLFMGPIFPTLLNDAQSRMHLSGKVTSVFFVGSSLGSMTIPWLIGQLIIPYGATAVMITILCSILLATGCYYLLNKKQRTILPPSPKYHTNKELEIG